MRWWATSPGVLQASQIPERLEDTTTWNCSVPHWPLFRRHFRCNRRQDCASGEDEVQCPYSPCEHGGVSFQGQCYFIMENYNNANWGLAQEECRKVEAYLASLTTHRKWTDVMNWLHLGAPWKLWELLNQVYLGAMDAPASMPHMWVKYHKKTHATVTVGLNHEHGDLAKPQLLLRCQ